MIDLETGSYIHVSTPHLGTRDGNNPQLTLVTPSNHKATIECEACLSLLLVSPWNVNAMWGEGRGLLILLTGPAILEIVL